MRNIFAVLFLLGLSITSCKAQSTFFTVNELKQAISGSRTIGIWTYLHKQGSPNLALKGIRLDSLALALDETIGDGGGGGPISAYYQTVRFNGTNLTQRDAINFKNGAGIMSFSAVDNPGTNASDVSINLSGNNLIAGSPAIVITNGAGAALLNASIDIDPSQIDLNSLGGSLNLSQLASGGATVGQVIKWNGTSWAAATDATGGGGGTVYTGGTGINVTGTVISNTGDLSNGNEGKLVIIQDNPTQVSIVSNTVGSTDIKIIEGNAGISIVANDETNELTITNTGDIDASDDLTTTTTFNGDVTGIYSNIQIKPNVVTTTEILNQAVTGAKIDDMGASTGDLLKWNGSTWVPATIDPTHIVQEESVDLPFQPKLNFLSPGITAVNNAVNSRTDIQLDVDLEGLASNNVNGNLVRTSVGNITARTNAATEGLTWTNANGVSGNPTVSLANDLKEIEELTGIGVIQKDAAEDWQITPADFTGASTGQVLKWTGTRWLHGKDSTGISELRAKQLSDSLELGEIGNYSGKFVTARKNGLPLTVAFAGDSQFDQYQRNVQYFLSSEWGTIFKPNGPGYCAASDQATNVQGFGFNTVIYTGTWTKPNTITNTPPIVEEGINGRYSEISGSGTITFATAARAEWPNVEKFQNLKIYSKANGAVFTYNIDGAGAVTVTTASHGGVHVTTVTSLSNALHSIVITRTSGTLRIYGVSGYNTTAGNLTIHRIAQGSSSYESWANRMADTSYVSKLRTLYPVPQTIFFNLGSNDVLDGGNLDSLKGHIIRFITKFKLYMPNTDLILVTPLDQPNTPFIDMNTYRSAIKQIAKNYKNVKVCDLYEIFGDYQYSTFNGVYEADSTHWSALGAKVASPFLLDFLIPPSVLVNDILPKPSGNIYYVEKRFTGVANPSNALYNAQLARAIRGSQVYPFPDPWSAKSQAVIDITATTVSNALIYIQPGQVYYYGDSTITNNGSTDFLGTATAVDKRVTSGTASAANLYNLNINYYFGTGSQMHNLCKTYIITLFDMGTSTTPTSFTVSGEGEFYNYYGLCQGFQNLFFNMDNPKASVVFNFAKLGQSQWRVFQMSKAKSIVIKGAEVKMAGNTFLYLNNTTTTDTLNVYVEVNNMFNGEYVWGAYCDFWYVYILKNKGPMTFVSKIGNLYTTESGPIVYTNEKSNDQFYTFEYGNVIHKVGSQGYHNAANDCMFNFGDGLGSATTEINNKIIVKIDNMVSDYTILYYAWNKSAATSYNNSLVFECKNCEVRNSSYPVLLIQADTVRKDRNTCTIRGNYIGAGYALQFEGGGHTVVEGSLYSRNTNGAVFLNGLSSTLNLKANIVATGTNSIYATTSRFVKVQGFPLANKLVNANVTQQLSSYIIDSSVGW